MADIENPNSQNPPEPEPDEEALRLKSLAEKKYVAGNLKSALKYAKKANRLNSSLAEISELLTAFKILRTAGKTVGLAPLDGTLLANSTSATAPPDYYCILQVERFAHINTIKRQYKKLALILHPDKNSFVASEEAFKHVGEAFRVLSDKIRRKEYDMRLRIAMQSEAEAAAAAGVVRSEIGEVGTFWTSCSTCRLLHQFDRKYLGQNLVCPSCKKSFKAVEVDDKNEKEDEGVEQGEKVVATRVSERIRARKGGKMSSVVEILGRVKGNKKESRDASEDKGLRFNGAKKDLEVELASGRLGSSGDDGVIKGLRSRSRRKEETSGGDTVMTRTRAKRAKVGEEDMMTLAQMQILAKKKVGEERMKLKGKDRGKETEEREKNMEIFGEKDKETGEGKEIVKKKVSEGRMKLKGKDKGKEAEKEKEKNMENIEENESQTREGEEMENDKSKETELEKDQEMENKRKDTEQENKKNDMDMGNVTEREKRHRQRQGVIKTDKVKISGRRASKVDKDSRVDEQQNSRPDNLDIVASEELGFYEFDDDRPEKRFKAGQVWATYDSEDGMPRHYALIDEVVTTNPIEVRLSWLEFQSNGDEQLINWEAMGFHVSCGRFKVSEKNLVKSMKMFSHIADFERVAKELYWIYLKKGSVWALYNENVLNHEGREPKDGYCYDIVVILTSYSEIYGISMVFLEKVAGFRTVFKRRDIGVPAIRWLGKVDFRLFSHQIPAKKLSGKDCWELDPSSLPPEPHTIGSGI